MQLVLGYDYTVLFFRNLVITSYSIVTNWNEPTKKRWSLSKKTQIESTKKIRSLSTKQIEPTKNIWSLSKTNRVHQKIWILSKKQVPGLAKTIGSWYEFHHHKNQHDQQKFCMSPTLVVVYILRLYQPHACCCYYDTETMTTK